MSVCVSGWGWERERDAVIWCGVHIGGSSVSRSGASGLLLMLDMNAGNLKNREIICLLPAPGPGSGSPGPGVVTLSAVSVHKIIISCTVFSHFI